ncbi:MAG TPA: MFS transporter, partial [Chloroflexota bacterium]|nr:MFS transporter [Chloroflexota bacterium]
MGALSDHFGRKPFMVAGALLGLAALWVYPLSAGALLVLFVARAVEGLASASLTPATLGFLADTTEPEATASRGRTMAYYEMATLIGIGSGYATGGVLWQHLGDSAFHAASGLYLLSAVVVWRWVRGGAPSGRPAHRWRDYVAVVRQPRVLRFAPAWLCVTAVIGLWFNNVIFQLAGPRRAGQLLTGGFSGGQVSLMLGLFVLVLVAGTFGWSRVFDRFPSKTDIMAVALAGLFVVCITLLVLNHRGGHAWLGVLLPLLAVGVAVQSGFTPAALAYLADITEDFTAERGAIMGLYSIFLSAGEIGGGAAGGPFAQAWGMDGMIGLTLALATAAAATVLLLRDREARHPPNDLEKSTHSGLVPAGALK